MELLDGHLLRMEEIAEYEAESEEYVAKEESEKNFRYWMGSQEEENGQRGNGEAFKLRDSLNHYYAFLNNIYNSQLQDSLQKAPEEIKDSYKGKKWERYTFEGPVIANIATLETIKLEILQQQKEVLDILSLRLGAPQPFQPDTIIPFTAPLAQVVPAGAPFQTRLLVGLSSKTLKPKFSSSSGSIQLIENGNMGMLTLQADGKNIPEGKTEGLQQYAATIEVPKATGGYETLTFRDEFVVRKPELLVSSAAVQLLYRNCGNKLNIMAPTLGQYYNPQVKARQARIEQSQRQKTVFMVLPQGNKCILEVSSLYNGQEVELGKLPYRVVAPPKPEFIYRVNGNVYNGFTPVPKNSRISLQVKPDKDFKEQLPRDARYRIDEIRVLMGDGLGVPKLVKRINLGEKDPTQPLRLSLPAVVRQAKAGTKVYIQVHKLYRVNFRNQREEVKLSELTRTLSLTLR